MTPQSRPTSLPSPWQNASSGGAEHHQAAWKARSAASNTPSRASDASSEEQRGLTLYRERLCHSGGSVSGVCVQQQNPLTPGALGPFLLERIGRPGTLRCTRQGLAVHTCTGKGDRALEV